MRQRGDDASRSDAAVADDWSDQDDLVEAADELVHAQCRGGRGA